MAQALWQRSILRGLDAFWELQTKSLRRAGFSDRWLELDPKRTAGLTSLRTLVTDDKGQGPIWVFVHGFCSKAQDWAPLLPLIAPHCAQTVALDLPGHGLSPLLPDGTLTPDTLLSGATEALRQLVPPQRGCVIVSNSMGGLVAVELNKNLPERVRATVLISPYGAPMSHAVHSGLIDDFTLDSWDKAKKFVTKLYPNGNVPPPGPLVTAVAMLAHLNRPHYLALRSSAFTNPPLTPEALQKMPPTLLVWGTVDYLMPRVGLEFFRSNLPAKTSRVITPSRFSHMPFLDLAPELAGEILGWAQAWDLLIDAPKKRLNVGIR